MKEVVEEVVEEVVSEPVVEEKKGKRAKLSRAQVSERFDEIIQMLNLELEKTRENKKRDVSVSTWKSIITDVKRIKNNTLPSVRKKITVSNHQRTGGFDKPKRLSDEMLKFTGWDRNGQYSQNNVTTFLCQYIKENGLQNPENRKNILLDDTLTRLLRPAEVLAEPTDAIYYYTLQQLIKPHLLKE